MKKPFFLLIILACITQANAANCPNISTEYLGSILTKKSLRDCNNIHCDRYTDWSVASLISGTNDMLASVAQNPAQVKSLTVRLTQDINGICEYDVVMTNNSKALLTLRKQ